MIHWAWGLARVKEIRACGHAERRTSKSGVRHRRKFGVGVGPHAD